MPIMGRDKMNILLLEDDKVQREYLSKIIQKNYFDIRVYEAQTIAEAEYIVKNKSINLFLVDINLPDGSGLDFIKAIRKIEKYKLTGVVFITNQVIQIIDAFKNTHCYDFLIKPFNIEDIKNIIDIFYKDNRNQTKEGPYIILPIDGGISVKIYEEDIVFVEYSLRVCTIYTTNNKYINKTLTLTKLLNMFKSDKIVQSHKSYIVNLSYIEKIEKQQSKIWFIYFTARKEVVHLSRNYKLEVFEKWIE